MEGPRREASACIYNGHRFVDSAFWSNLAVLPFSLFFVIAAFVGSITIPLTLVLLGSFFARIEIPRPISRLPIAAILSACIAKLVLLPVIGVFIVKGMVKRGFIPPQNRVQIFVTMYLSGTPISITYASDSIANCHQELNRVFNRQLVVSALYAPDDNLDTLTVSIELMRAPRVISDIVGLGVLTCTM